MIIKLTNAAMDKMGDTLLINPDDISAVERNTSQPGSVIHMRTGKFFLSKEAPREVYELIKPTIMVR